MTYTMDPTLTNFILEFQLMYFQERKKTGKKLFNLIMGSCKTFAISYIFRASEMT